jgi:ribosomal protein S18 acetylase RimI-like enzyme
VLCECERGGPTALGWAADRKMRHAGVSHVVYEPLIREATPADLPFIRHMLYESSFAMEEPKPSLDAIEAPEIIRYLPEWDRRGDRVLIAEADGRAVGAAWYRLYPAVDPGYGFVDTDTPELSIAVAADWRGRGVGKALLGRLLEVARCDGFPGLSLSVARSNVTARSLYERCGFVVVAIDEVEDGVTMRGSSA